MPEPKQRAVLDDELDDEEGDDDDEDVEGKLADDEQLTLDLDHVPDEVLEYARRELGETEEVKCLTIHELREMIYGMKFFFFFFSIKETNVRFIALIV